ncbi:lipopolysaccharide transport system permease protein [Rhizobium sp. BK313]|uniref:ABC transporter permease n=1 Tax=Rhizobium sp. BK313 TaxID=2587081 RepID=UPI00105B911E|nr:ABC transporter permease [Rhizobium sp. BK313]MBB3457282.1 lipopolysaccharide transport system permease protein [Rhizobium sp. BK313]
MLRSIWNYRHFIIASIKGELRGRFARSRLGALWFILHPLAQALIFSIVLSEVMRAKMPNMTNPAAYPIYLLSGMAAWGLFSEILMRSMNVFIEQAAALKKISFPRLCLPIIVWGSALINHVLLLVSIAVIFLFFGQYPGLAWLYLIPGMLLISALAFGIGVFLGVLNVFVRDVAQAMTVVMQLWFWFTPIVYVKSAVPESFQNLLRFNPMASLVNLYQNALLLNEGPSWMGILPSVVVGAIMVLLAFTLFRRASADLVDAL